jgi:hypothetical protein
MNKKHKVILLTMPEIHHVLRLLYWEQGYYGIREDQHERRRKRIVNQLRHHVEANARRAKNA